MDAGAGDWPLPSSLATLGALLLVRDSWVDPNKLEPAGVRWHGWLEVEAAALTLAGRLCARFSSNRRG